MKKTDKIKALEELSVDTNFYVFMDILREEKLDSLEKLIYSVNTDFDKGFAAGIDFTIKLIALKVESFKEQILLDKKSKEEIEEIKEEFKVREDV